MKPAKMLVTLRAFFFCCFEIVALEIIHSGQIDLNPGAVLKPHETWRMPWSVYCFIRTKGGQKTEWRSFFMLLPTGSAGTFQLQ